MTDAGQCSVVDWLRNDDAGISGVKGRPRPQVRATRDAGPPYDVHLELVDEDDEA